MRILGIDFGATAVRAVEIDSAFVGFEIKEYHEAPIAPGQDRHEVAAALVASLPKKPDRIATALPTRATTFRNLRPPTRDKKAISAAVEFELEDELPFATDQSASDWTILRQTSGATDVHVAVGQLSPILAELHALSETPADPDLLTTEAWALRGLLNRIVPNPQGPLLLVLLGHDRSIVYGHADGRPVVCRELPWGGLELTNALGNHYSLPLEQAEGTKLENGFILTNGEYEQATPEQRELSAALEAPVEELIQMIRQAELSCKGVALRGPVAIYLAGGTSLLPGLAPYLAERLRLPVTPLRSLSAVSSQSAVQYSEAADAKFTLALAAGLCLVGQEKSSAINFRKGSRARKREGTQIDWRHFKRPVLAAATVLGCMLVSFWGQTFVYRSRLAEADRQLETGIRSFFGGSVSQSALRNYLSRPSELKKSVRKEVETQRELSRLFGPNPRSPLGYLRELSKGVPKDTITDLIQFQVGAATSPTFSPTELQSVSLSFLVSNPQMADRLASQLGPRFQDFQKSKLEEVTLPTDPNAPEGAPQKRWKVTFTGKATEASYGNRN
jgi:type IV pilus assembly protein PilM